MASPLDDVAAGGLWPHPLDRNRVAGPERDGTAARPGRDRRPPGGVRHQRPQLGGDRRFLCQRRIGQVDLAPRCRSWRSCADARRDLDGGDRLLGLWIPALHGERLRQQSGVRHEAQCQQRLAEHEPVPRRTGGPAVHQPQAPGLVGDDPGIELQRQPADEGEVAFTRLDDRFPPAAIVDLAGQRKLVPGGDRAERLEQCLVVVGPGDGRAAERSQPILSGDLEPGREVGTQHLGDGDDLPREECRRVIVQR
jgi:hypothetical protein